jgi:hypothetical protein
MGSMNRALIGISSGCATAVHIHRLEALARVTMEYALRYLPAIGEYFGKAGRRSFGGGFVFSSSITTSTAFSNWGS